MILSRISNCVVLLLSTQCKGGIIISSPITVIIADDESAIRNGLENIVSSKQFGTQVIATADNGNDALLLIRQYHPDIAIIDINMPEIDGLEVIHRAIESSSMTRFIILSGHSEFAYAQAAIRYGVKSYFLKPLNILEFREEFFKQCQEILAGRYTAGELSTQKLSSLVDSSRILFLNQLVQSKIFSPDDILSKLSVLHLTITNGNSCVVIFHLQSLSEDGSLKPDEINRRYICGLFENFAMESWIYDENHILAIFNLNDINNATFRSAIKHCIELIKFETNHQIIVGIGNIVPNLAQCTYSYLRAREALSYCIYETDTEIYDSNLICDKKPTFTKENIDFKSIVSFILHNDIPGITDYCNNFFQALFFIKMPPPNFIVGMCMYLIMNVQNQITLQYPNKKIEFDSSYEDLSAFESVQKLKDWLINFFISNSEAVKDITDDSNALIKASKEYIQKNMHRNIKAKEVAAQINLSETYFSIYFKDKTGVNFRDYILNVRIDYAKILLRSRKESISEIAYLTGYQDYRSFSRAFKNETGMSPSNYSNSQD